jgi:hypothetical protein
MARKTRLAKTEAGFDVSAEAGFDVSAEAGFDVSDKFIDIKQTREITRLSEATVRRWLTLGRLRRFKCGGKTLLLLSDVLACVHEVK